MLIGIDASRTTNPKKTGVEWYGVEVIRELAKLDTTNRYRLYSWEPLKKELADLPDNFQNVIVPPKRFWPFTALSAELRRNPVEGLFIPSHLVPRVRPERTVVAVHDLGFRHFRANYTWYHYLSLTYGTRLSVRWAEKVVVASQAVADDVMEYYHTPASKLALIPDGYDRDLYTHVTPQDVVTTMQHYRIKDPFLLFLGRLEVRKNVARIIEAFYRLQDSGLFGGQLVLAGDPGVGYDEIRALIAKRRGDSSIILTGYVADNARAALLRGARAFIFPSLFEGFGIPILEAFAAGTPVLTSDRGATKEVAGDAALLVDPEDVEAIHQGMQRLLSDQKATDDFIKRGAVRAASYGWDQTAVGIHQLLTA